MSDTDTFTDWMNSEPELEQIIEEISDEILSEEEQAQEVFEVLCEKFNLPKYPDSFSAEDLKDYEKRGISSPRSVYEEIGIIRYLEPDDDPRGIVLFAIYNIKTANYMPLDECEDIHFQEVGIVPDSYSIYYLGEGAQSEMHFLEEGETLDNPAIKYSSKIVISQ